jgi:hypothetical protein
VTARKSCTACIAESIWAKLIQTKTKLFLAWIAIGETVKKEARKRVEKSANVEFCYRILAEAGMAYDRAADKPCDCYCKIGVAMTKPPLTEEEYNQLHSTWAVSVARSTGVKLEHVIPISYKEWAENQEEDDGET